jgi:GT2 family glycosyltransferase
MNTEATVCLSVVSHGHAAHLERLFGSIRNYDVCVERAIVRSNFPEDLSNISALVPENTVFAVNERRLGFGENHNLNLADASSEFVLIINPDVRFTSNPFDRLLEYMHENPSVALITPKVVNSDGLVEDSVRNFPSIFTILKKALGLGNGGTIHHQDGFVDVPWVAGMFMLIRRSAFQELAGFDENFYLYYEDVDFCARLHKAGYRVVVDFETEVIHDAQRESRKSFKFLKWHIASMLRYFFKHGLFRYR